jgi:formylmethanofuran dehydrogenase subunit C
VTAETTLTLRRPLAQRVDASAVAWDALRGLEARAIEEQELWIDGGGRSRVGDLFEVAAAPGEQVRLIGDLALMDGIGSGLAGGMLVVEGNAGWYLGQGMRGGAIEVRGNAGPQAGAALPGAKRGMAGGEIVIRGSAGPGLGSGCRRGLIAVEGEIADGAGRAMLAGTVVAFGSIGAEPGLWSKRGSLVALRSVTPPATYRYACTYRPSYLPVTLGYLKRRYGCPVTPEHLTGLYRRYSGDLAELGAGEILVWTR